MSKNSQAAALVTGGAGFIGSRLVQLLTSEHYRVVIVDSLLWGDDRVAAPISVGSVQLIRGDIRNQEVMDSALRLGPFHIVFHLAAIHYIPYCAAHPLETLSVNVLGTQAVLEALSAAPPEHFVFVSTGDVYAPREAPHTEDDHLRPFTMYGISKLFGEYLVAAAAAESERTSYMVARLFNVFGSSETNPHVIPDIIAQVRQGNLIRLGNTWPRRDYIHVRDVARALLALAGHQGGAQCEYFNVGTGVASSVDDILMTLRRILNRDLVVDVEESRVRKVERPHLQASTKRILQLTGWTPLLSLEAGLREVCEAHALVASI
jgi:UDP-glucose 4-epimerase